MAKAETVTVSYGVTKKTKIQYESLRLEESIVLRLEEGESVTAVIDQARDFLEAKVDKDAATIIAKGK